MGDRVARERPEGLAERKPKKREAGEGEAFDMPKRRKVCFWGPVCSCPHLEVGLATHIGVLATDMEAQLPSTPMPPDCCCCCC